MTTVTEAATGHYEVRDVEFGRVYRWCPGYVVVECDCGEVSTLTESAPVCCWCGADYAGRTAASDFSGIKKGRTG